MDGMEVRELTWRSLRKGLELELTHSWNGIDGISCVTGGDNSPVGNALLEFWPGERRDATPQL